MLQQDETIILPGQRIGMLGGGQLGRMSILAGRAMGYRFSVFDPARGSAAAMVADGQTVSPFSDLDALKQFGASVDRVTLEFENIPSAAVEAVEASGVSVFPGKEVLHICQNRRREKRFLQEHGFPCAPFAVAESADELEAGLQQIGYPCVIKTADFGYDGKGQVKLEAAPESAASLWEALGGGAVVIEGWVDFALECSVIVARNARGEVKVFPVAENIHKHHILHISLAPARILPASLHAAESLACEIAEAIGVVGLLAVELFVKEGGGVIVNELAPRPHNSGHYTMDACATSQFEQHIRAICGLPLGDVRLLSPVAMVNFLGDAWPRDAGGSISAPDWCAWLGDPHLKLHVYDKGEPSLKRKMGHVNLLAGSAEEALGQAEAFCSRHTVS